MNHRKASLAAIVLAVVVLLVAAPAHGQKPAAAGPFQVASPNRAIVVTITTKGQVAWSIALRGAPITRPSPLAMILDGGRTLGAQPVVTGSTTRSADTILKPVVRIKRAEVRDRFNERRIDFAGDYSLIVRAYDDGVAYRWVTRLPGEITVRERGGDLRVPGRPSRVLPGGDQPAVAPGAAVQAPEDHARSRRAGSRRCPRWWTLRGGLKMVITEADLFDYPGMDLTGGAGDRTA